VREASLPVEQLYKDMASGPEGMTVADAAKRLLEVGQNQISEGHHVPLWKKLVPHVTNLLAILLWIAGVLAYFGGMPELAWAVFAVIVINAVFSFVQEFKAEKATEALKHMLPTLTTVIRDGQPARIDALGVVPGDIVMLEAGDAVPADCRVVSSSSLLVNNSSLTGESEPVARSENVLDSNGFTVSDYPNLIFMGTSVVNGNCKAIVLATGGKTEFGKVARLTQEVSSDISPLQKQIVSLTRVVAILSLVFGTVFFALGVIIKRPLIENFLFAIGIVVANVPEGLLPTVTLSLAMGMQRMARRHALVKKLTAVETLGSTTVILTDKTGTLTQNRMTVTRVYSCGEAMDIERAVPSDALTALLRGMVLANNARMTKKDDGSEDFVGDPTEAALLVGARAMGADLDVLVRRLPRLREIPFDSRRKRMTTIHRVSGEIWAECKGAPVEIVSRCSTVLAAQGVVPLDETARAGILAANDEMALSGLRVLGFARRQLQSLSAGDDETESDLTFTGLAAMFDPPRPEVADAVAKAHRAGIRIGMVTGDYGLTAESIARRIGIVSGPRPRIVTGSELLKMEEQELIEVVRDNPEIIFARVSPEDKMRIAKALQATGNIVAVTGDGVNDAPALKRADIGVAMGRTGTDVAKEAADMILTDDNFASIVSAIEEGRTVYENIKKFITYILASNVPEIIPYIVFVAFNVPLPLTIMQVLAIDLGTDLLPALALGLEPPEPGIMERPPRPKNERLLDWKLLLRAYGFLGMLEACVGMAAYFWFLLSHGWTFGQQLDPNGLVYHQATAITFVAIVVSQVFNVFAARTDRESVFKVGIFKNRYVLMGIVYELVLASILIYTPLFQRIFTTGPLGVKEWAFLWAVAPIVLVAEEVRKFYLRWAYRRVR
jgi:P-type Ca2+ transporter type 2C